MIKLETPVFNIGLKIVLEGQNNSYMVYLLDTFHNKPLNIRHHKDYGKALKNYNTRCIGL